MPVSREEAMAESFQNIFGINGVKPRRLFESERRLFEQDAKKTAKALGHSLGHFEQCTNYGYDIAYWNTRKGTTCQKCGAGVELLLVHYLPGRRPLSGAAISDECSRRHKKIGKCSVGRLPPKKGWNIIKRARFWWDRRGWSWRKHVFKATWGYGHIHSVPLPDKPMLQLKAPGFLRGRCNNIRQTRLDRYQKNDIRNAYRAMDRIAIQESLEGGYDETDVRQKRKWPPSDDDRAGGLTQYELGRNSYAYDPWLDDDGYYGGGDDYLDDWDDEDPVRDFLRGKPYEQSEASYEEQREAERQDILWEDHHFLEEEQWEWEAEHDRMMLESYMREAPEELPLDKREARKITKKFNDRNRRRK